MLITKKIAGTKAKRIGEQFETMVFFESRRARTTLIKLPDGCRRVNGPRGLKLLPVKTPFDFVLLSKGKVITFDAKTVDGNTFSHSMIDKAQMQSLLKCQQDATRSGYLIWFRVDDVVNFFSATELAQIKRGESLKSDQGLKLGSKGMFNLQLLFQPNESNNLIQTPVTPI